MSPHRLHLSSLLGMLAAFVALLPALLARGAGPDPAAAAVPRHILEADGRWLLASPDGHRFDASGLLRLPDGTLLTVNDKGLPPCRIELRPKGVARLVPLTNLFAPSAVLAVAGRLAGALDAEGLARDGDGRIYLCEEGTRGVFRMAPGGTVERLPIDWSPVRRCFSEKDGNASFEGIAAGGGRLYVANERSTARILEVDLATLRVVGDFAVRPSVPGARETSYSDLCWWDGDLWVLCREDRCVLRVDPATHAVKAEFDYAGIELAPENVYVTPLPYGFVEGLAVDDGSVWLVVDNNGLPRRSAPTDTRGLLFRCARPDRAGAKEAGAGKRNGVPVGTGTP